MNIYIFVDAHLVVCGQDLLNTIQRQEKESLAENFEASKTIANVLVGDTTNQKQIQNYWKKI